MRIVDIFWNYSRKKLGHRLWQAEIPQRRAILHAPRRSKGEPKVHRQASSNRLVKFAPKPVLIINLGLLKGAVEIACLQSSNWTPHYHQASQIAW